MKERIWKAVKKWFMPLAASAAICCTGVPQAKANVVEEFSQALKSGTPTLELRMGYEYSNYHERVPAGGKIKHPANAINLRTRVGYRTGDFLDSNAYIQLQNVTNLMEQYSFVEGTHPKLEGDKANDAIEDPDGSRVQQAYIDIKALPNHLFRIGRQEIILDDARLIGNINWRQNGQSFDALSITNTSFQDLKLFASYINQVNTIYLGHMDLDKLILLHADYSGIKAADIRAFCYLLDDDDNPRTKAEKRASRDSATYGLRVKGDLPVTQELTLKYALDYAHQSDFEDGDDHRADMFNAFIGAKVSMFDLGAGYSYLSGQDGHHRPFDTLFSTTHKFNGWADQFVSTNGGGLRDGLQDAYVQVGTDYMGVKLTAVYHYFDTSENDYFDGNYGDEIDLLASRKITDNLSGLLSFAYYSQDDEKANGYLNPTRDEQVFWARLHYAF